MPETTGPVSVPGSADAGRRSAGRAPTGPIAVGAVLFAVGLVAVGVIMVLFATGAHDLPLWLNLTAMLAPVGFGIGLIGIFTEARSGRRARAERAAGRAAGPLPRPRPDTARGETGQPR